MGPTERELYPNPANGWFAVTVRPNHEKAAHLAFRSQELDSFLPLYRSRRRWSDRTREIEVPLFTGYVFCRFSSAQRARVLRSPGVSGIVNFAGKPEPLSEEEIASMRRMVDSGLAVEPWPALHRGERVRIVTGPLRDLEGVLAAIRGTSHVVVNVNLLERSVAVGVARDAVEPVA